MNPKEWMQIYRRIERDFGFPREREEESRNYLSELIGERFISAEEIRRVVGDEVYVVGYSPSLEKELDLITEKFPVIAADDSAVILQEYGISPAIVLTDLDGEVDKLAEIDSIFGIHAHGDNLSRLPMAELFDRRFGTTQIEPLWNVFNFGGFTDGDRCAFLAAHFNAKIHLVGFDFSNPRIKKGKNTEMKRKKLRWARRLLSILEEGGAVIIWESLK